MKKYNPNKIEKKWQKTWEQAGVFKNSGECGGKENYYTLFEFPYPSGNLHIGHWYAFAMPDIFARMKRMQGFNVLFPIGFDAFGLPAENAAIKRGLDPKKWTLGNIKTMKKQLRSMGGSFDWSREVVTCSPDYYRWTQWLFLQFLKNNLAYQSETPVNWCPSCKTVLANEQAVGGKCDRCVNAVEQRNMKQWQIKITDYAEQLLQGLDKLEKWPEQIKEAQRNWIGKSVGTEITFPLFGIPGQKDGTHKVTVFTTRPDTLFGATFLVISAELAKKWIDVGWQAPDGVKQYVEKTLAEEKARSYGEPAEKTGIFSGIYAENPVNKERIPVWVANYVVSGYGTGAIMAVPAHDERDGEFAKKFQIPIRHVVIPTFGEHHEGEIFRKTISTVVQRKSDGKFLFLKWKQFNWVAPVIGGIDDGETPEQAAEREVLEEAGLKVKAVRRLGGEFEAHFFADNKNEWRYRVDQPILLEIIGEAEQDAEGKEKFEILWLTADEALKVNTYEYNVVGLKRFIQKEESFTGDGKVVNSDFLNNLSTYEAKQKIVEWLEKNGHGKKAVTYKLHDWVVSRQRYWGCPIPVIHCKVCGTVPVPEDQLPVELPRIKDYLPTGDGKSPLAKVSRWVNVKCPQCGKRAKRETDTLDTFIDSSWYFFRYTDPKNETTFADKEKMRAWMPVDFYSGGAEHTTMHLLYSRFFTKVMYDLKLVEWDEPYEWRMNRGLILGPDGQKMSKSKGNVIDPDENVKKYGADSVRMYLAFIGPYNEPGTYPWDMSGIEGVHKFLKRIFLRRVWVQVTEGIYQPQEIDEQEFREKELEILLNKTIKKVTEDIESLKFNTAISSLMIFLNQWVERGLVDTNKEIKIADTFIKLLSPFAPHIAEELWHALGNETFIVNEPWPAYDESKLLDETVTVSVQFNGKFRGTISVARGSNQEAVVNVVKSDHKLSSYLSSGPKKTIFVRDKIINFVV